MSWINRAVEEVEGREVEEGGRKIFFPSVKSPRESFFFVNRMDMKISDLRD